MAINENKGNVEINMEVDHQPAYEPCVSIKRGKNKNNTIDANNNNNNNNKGTWTLCRNICIMVMKSSSGKYLYSMVIT